jgi:hypothetical protein
MTECWNVQVHYVLIPASVLESRGGQPLTAYDVYTASLQLAESRLSEGAHACGLMSVPTARENFTFTLAPSAHTSECQEYAEASGNALSSWAATHRCSRCPVLLSETRYKVRCETSLAAACFLWNNLIAHCLFSALILMACCFDERSS